MAKQTDDTYLPKNPSEPDTMLPPLDGRWWITDGFSYFLHPSQNAYTKMMRIAAENPQLLTDATQGDRGGD